MTTCQQPRNKYDLEKVRDYPNKPLRDYIRCFSKTQKSIPNINSDEAISAFIRGLRHHDALRTKLLRKRPDFVQTCSRWRRSGQMLMRPTSRLRKTLAKLLDLTSKITASMTGAMIDVMTTVVMIGATTVTATTINVIDIGRTTSGGGRAAIDQLIMPSTPSSQHPSATMRMLTPRSFRVPA
jgi:hypothetical protein